jgi:pimeloyl-ACP methyl ester carboxylesterase
MTVEPLGHEIVGSGPRRLIVLNDWLCDTSTWTAARAYLDRTRFTWAFTDLRGYGRSRGRSGEFNLLEAAADVIALADALAWQHFSIISHSMSTYVAMHLGQHAAQRVERVVLITPGPPAVSAQTSLGSRTPELLRAAMNAARSRSERASRNACLQAGRNTNVVAGLPPENLAPLCKQLEVEALLQCGHYPMEELPPRTVSLVEHFCGR